MNVFVTGGSGFVGSHVIDALVERGHTVVALVHREAVHPRGGAVRSVEGDLSNKDALDLALTGCQAAIHLVGIIAERAGRTFDKVHVEGTQHVLDAVGKRRIARYLHMSAIGARPDAPSRYHQTKWEAEQRVRAAGKHAEHPVDWTIFRPSLIHGPEGEFVEMMAGWARGKRTPWFAMPYFGAGLLGLKGTGKLQPVFVKDVARAFADALENPTTFGQTYEIGGPDEMTWPQMYRIAAHYMVGQVKPTLPVPAWYARALTRIVPGSLLPFSRDQVLMSQEDNICSNGPFVQDFGWTPRPFDAMLAEYADRV